MASSLFDRHKIAILLGLIVPLALSMATGCQQDKMNFGYGEPPLGEDYPFDPVPVEVMSPQPSLAMAPDSDTDTAASPSGNSYVVQKGDTLWSIAHRRYGNGQRWKSIHQANPGLEPIQMRVGQTISLP